ncbi:TRAF3-interacting protein 1 isoform X2 [Amia ocellicauda]|uniref:TRAF3-interacting protein 1 isoform X2 n=1 Tax=Amia ocellicauda TaxID=2972642 RepID=UPI003463C21B
MNGSVVKKTQDTLGKVIKKPPLTEKLLNKPPFRYLHDIFTEVIRTTGFMKGLFVEAEMKSDNVKDKDAKITFLQKVIDVVIMVTGEPLSVKPARIVAGHEPEKTNELLQALGRCCLNKLSGEDAVKRVLAGEKPDLKGKPTTSKSQDKENRESKEDDKKRHRAKEEKKDAEIKDRSTSRDRKDPDLPKEQDGRKTEKDRHREEKGRERERTKDRDREKDKSRDREKDKGREKDRDKAKERDPQREKDREKRRERPKDSEEKTREPEKAEKRSRAADETRNRKPSEQSIKSIKDESEDDDEPPQVLDTEPAEVFEQPSVKPETEVQSPARIPRPSSAKGQRRMPNPGGQGIISQLDGSDSEADVETPSAERSAPLENGDVTDGLPPHATQRRIPRPSSARPAPPRVKRQDSTDMPSVESRLGSGKPASAVIVEGKKLSDDEEDDDEQFVVEEAMLLPPDMPELEMEPSVELKGDDKHGVLVKKILETKKDYETSVSTPKTKDQDSLVSEAARRKERDLVSRDIEKLRSSIQTVCRSALPLGKIMDYIQEDMDSMQNELQMWRRENKEHARALLQEQRITDSAVEPLKAELVELDQLIKEQQDKICAVKANILKNEDKIQKMVSSINFSSRT